MWYYTLNGQQAGPVSEAELADRLTKELPYDTLVWKEGMANWQAANSVAEFGDLNQGSPPPLPPAQANTQSPYAPPSSGSSIEQIEEHYPLPKVKKASYGLLIGSMLLAVISMVALISYFMTTGFLTLQELEKTTSSQIEEVINAQMASEGSLPNELPLSDVDTLEQLFEIFTPTFFLLSFTTAGFFFWSSILGIIYVYRAWQVLQPTNTTTSPGMAAGLLLLPLFNLYWAFIAYVKWAQEWNRLRHRYRNLQQAPKVNENVYLAMAICQCASLVISFAGLGYIVLYFVGMKSMCDTINYAAENGSDVA